MKHGLPAAAGDQSWAGRAPRAPWSCMTSPHCGWPGVGGGLTWQGHPSQTPHTEGASLIGGLCSSSPVEERPPHHPVYRDNLKQKGKLLRAGSEGGGTFTTSACGTHPERSPQNCQEVAGKRLSGERPAQNNRAMPDHRTGTRSSAGGELGPPSHVSAIGFQQGLSCW